MTYQKATKMSVKVSMAEKAAKTIQYIIHLTCNLNEKHAVRTSSLSHNFPPNKMTYFKPKNCFEGTAKLICPPEWFLCKPFTEVWFQAVRPKEMKSVDYIMSRYRFHRVENILGYLQKNSEVPNSKMSPNILNHFFKKLTPTCLCGTD